MRERGRVCEKKEERGGGSRKTEGGIEREIKKGEGILGRSIRGVVRIPFLSFR